MSASVHIAAADPVIAAALAEQLRDAGFVCTEHKADMAVCDADAPQKTAAPRVLYLASDITGCPKPALQKPVRKDDLIACLQRMAEGSDEHALVDGWVLSAAERLLKRAGSTPVELTEKEAELLICLLAAPGRTAKRQKLLEEVWGYKQGTDTHTLETHLHRLRAKLKEIGGEGWIAAADDGYRIAP